MPVRNTLPKVVLICHENDALDCEGMASWLANSFCLAGLVILRERPASWLQKLRREYRRVGLVRLLDILLFRLFYQLRYGRLDAAWKQAQLQALRHRYPADTSLPPRLVCHDPNSEEVEDFLRQLQPDIAIARCKRLLQSRIYTIARKGTFALHPGICPEYRNAHGCFWALVNRDLDYVGMTLLKVDEGVDTGPIYLQTSYPFNESEESHVVIQYRVVLENLGTIADVLTGICRGTVKPVALINRRSMSWGQPWLTAYCHWKRAAREALA